jgi:hypothetical protein
MEPPNKTRSPPDFRNKKKLGSILTLVVHSVIVLLVVMPSLFGIPPIISAVDETATGEHEPMSDQERAELRYVTSCSYWRNFRTKKIIQIGLWRLKAPLLLKVTPNPLRMNILLCLDISDLIDFIILFLEGIFVTFEEAWLAVLHILLQIKSRIWLIRTGNNP